MSKSRKKITVKAVEEADTPYVPDVNMAPEPEQGSWGKGGLTLQQRRFVRAYLGTAAGNATEAARMAGYRSENSNSLRAAGSRLLTYGNVQRALSRGMARQLGGKKWTLRGLVEIANTSMADFVTVDAQGQPTVDFGKAQAVAAIGAIKKLKCTPDGDIVAIELYDRKSALDSLAKIHGSLVERVEHTGKNGGPINLRNLTNEELETLERIALNANRRSGAPDDLASRN